MVDDNIEQGPLSPAFGTFESLQSQSNSIRRARPPNIIIGDENRVPLRPDPHSPDSRSEKLAKRESKIGLRSIFGRPKSTKDKDGKDLDASTSSRERSRSGGIRASLAEISNWPYSLHSSRSDLALSSPPPPTSSRSTTSPGLHSQTSASRSRQHGGGSSKPLPAPPSPTPGSWMPSPLFQVYPQAIRHATLPACTASLETLAKLSGNRNSLSSREGPAPEEGGEKREEKGPKLHQRNGGSRSILNWTTRTYALVTSGYLLQYAGDGAFDRLPEKVLRLSKDSAAFASDLIPGRHWVIQVVSSLDGNGIPATESRSFMSKLALRGTEKKHVSTLLMVCESAGDMDNWLAILRREIEELGGKKQLTETGELKKVDANGQLRTIPSQRTIVVRDPERFSTMVHQDFAWANDHALKERDHGLPAIPSAEVSPEFPVDDGSMTESHYSSDGQHLDSLRESTNRLSCISIGQRTYVTSANSSPACSPTRASFSSHPDDSKVTHENHPEVRLRPNAQAISVRRQSMQTMIPDFDADLDQSSRRHSVISTITNSSEGHRRQSVPNFSKRFSGLKPATEDMPAEEVSEPLTAVVVEPEPATKPSRKPPPTALVLSRPLSTVMDMPTPRSPLSPFTARSIDAMQDSKSVVDAPAPTSTGSTLTLDEAKSQSGGTQRTSINLCLAAKRLSTPQMTLDSRTAPRRFVSMTSLRTPAGIPAESASEAPRFILPSSVAARKAQFESASNANQEPPRSFSSPGAYKLDRKPATTPLAKFPSYKRSTFLAEDSSFRQAHHPFAQAEAKSNMNHDTGLSRGDKSDRPELQSPPLSPNSLLNASLRAKSSLGRRSMPQLAEGPPLAPPPTRALPPIPKRI
ncbi:peptidase family m20 m25 m40 protein [Seiridium cupressi]